MSTSTAADAAVLDALYGDLPPYRPELAKKTEVEGVVVPEVSSLPTISTSEAPSVMPSAELRVIKALLPQLWWLSLLFRRWSLGLPQRWLVYWFQ